MKLDPSKSRFGVGAGKILGYMVMKRGIEASPEHTKGIINLKSPTSVKNVQRLTDGIAPPNRFISDPDKGAKSSTIFLKRIRNSSGD